MAYYRRPYGAYRRRRAPARRYARYASAAPRRRPAVRRARAPARRVTRRAARCNCHSGASSLTPGDKFVIAQADPFEPRCFGGKVPDSSTLPSISTPLQYNRSLTSIATTQPQWMHAWAFYPNLYGEFVTAAGLSNSTVDWTTNSVVADHPQASAYGQNFEAFRPVAHAIRISCPYAPTSTTGFVHIALATETTFSGAGTAVEQYRQMASSLSLMSGYTFYKRVTLASLTQSPITLVNKWFDDTAFRYTSPYSSPQNSTATATNEQLTFHIPLQWGTLLIAVEGVSSSATPAAITPLQAEVITHLEGIPNKSGTLIGSTAAAFDSGILSGVSQAVAGVDFAHTEDQQSNYMNSFLNQVEAAATSTGGAMGRIAESLGRQAVNAGINAALQHVGGLGVGGVNNHANRLMNG